MLSSSDSLHHCSVAAAGRKQQDNESASSQFSAACAINNKSSTLLSSDAGLTTRLFRPERRRRDTRRTSRHPTSLVYVVVQTRTGCAGSSLHSYRHASGWSKWNAYCCLAASSHCTGQWCTEMCPRHYYPSSSCWSRQHRQHVQDQLLDVHRVISYLHLLNTAVESRSSQLHCRPYGRHTWPRIRSSLNAEFAEEKRRSRILNGLDEQR